MAMAGWVLETIYRSIKARRFVNAGFLSGPWVPLYGFACLAIAIVWNALATRFPIIAWPAVLILPTILEYLTAMIMERFFGMILWDYHDRRFNIKGRICLRFSAYWALLVVALILFIQPLLFHRIAVLGIPMGHFFAGFLLAALLIDTRHSIREVFNFKAVLQELRELTEQGKPLLPSLYRHHKGIKLPFDIVRLFKPLTAFPVLLKELRPQLKVFPDWLRERIEKRFGRD